MTCVDELGNRVRVKILDRIYFRDGYAVRLFMIMATQGMVFETLKKLAEKIGEIIGEDSKEVYERIYQRMRNIAKTGAFEVYQEEVENTNIKRWRIRLAADVYVSKRDKLALIVSRRGVKIVDCRFCGDKCPVWDVFKKAIV